MRAETKRNRTSFSICHIYFLLFHVAVYFLVLPFAHIRLVFRWKLTVQWSIDSQPSEQRRGERKYNRIAWIYVCDTLLMAFPMLSICSFTLACENILKDDDEAQHTTMITHSILDVLLCLSVCSFAVFFYVAWKGTGNNSFIASSLVWHCVIFDFLGRSEASDVKCKRTRQTYTLASKKRASFLKHWMSSEKKLYETFLSDLTARWCQSRECSSNDEVFMIRTTFEEKLFLKSYDDYCFRFI